MNRPLASLFAALTLLALLLTGCSASEDGPGSTPSTVDGGDGGAATEDDAAVTTPCNSGCRSDKGCITKPADPHMCGSTGTPGEACVDCATVGDDHACVAGKCGCLQDNDCTGSLVCDTTAHKCTTRCTAGSCATGCCNAKGFCTPGTATETCGASGSCLDCTKSLGKACIAGGKCGCNTAADCSSGYACDTTTHACTQACDAASPCNGGCCDTATSKCTGGYQQTTCGKSGGACTSCVGAAQGPSCVSATGSCGCSSYTDCPANMACDATTHLCTTTCSATQYCNGGCCSGTTCAAGTTNAACGANFTACKACSTLGDGPTCGATKKCGCASDTECQGGTVCGTKVGAKVCCLPKGAFSADSGKCCNSLTINKICQ